MRPELSKVNAVKNFKVPTTRRDVVHSRFIPTVASNATPLTGRHSERLNTVCWTTQCDNEF